MLKIGVFKSSHTGATLLELMVALAILGLGITALLQTLNAGIMYSNNTESKIRAINLSREGIEGVMNIRDTNWLRFSSDRLNCWIVDQYRSNCIGGGGTVIATGSYTLYSLNGVWILSGVTSRADPATQWDTYKSQFAVGLDDRGYFTQTGIANTPCTTNPPISKDCRTGFTREILIDKPDNGTNTGVLIVKSISSWRTDRLQEVQIETTLTNWKSNF